MLPPSDWVLGGGCARAIQRLTPKCAGKYVTFTLHTVKALETVECEKWETDVTDREHRPMKGSAEIVEGTKQGEPSLVVGMLRPSKCVDGGAS